MAEQALKLGDFFVLNIVPNFERGKMSPKLSLALGQFHSVSAPVLLKSETCPLLEQMELFDILHHVSFRPLVLTALWLS
jgi:hypothetical protein